MEAGRLYQSLRGRLYRRLPVLAVPLGLLDWRQGEAAGTDGAYFYAPPDWLAAADAEDVLLHSVLHAMLGHPWTRGRRDAARWDLACDMAAEFLRQRLLDRPLEGLYAQPIARESAYHAVCHGPRQSAAHDRLHELFIVPLFFLRLAAAGQMDVHVEKAGHQIFSGQIDRLKAHRFASCGRQSHDRFALNEDALPAQRLHILCAVQNDGVFQRVFQCFACFRA